MKISRRPALALALCATVVAGGGAAVAAPKAKPVCNLVTDETGDASIVTGQKSLDVVSADLASDAKNLTAVIRLDGAPGGANPQALGGTRYYFEFTAPGSDNPQYLYASIPFAGEPIYRTGEVTTTETNRSFSSDPVDESVKGSIKGNVLTMTAPLKAFSRVKLAPGAKLAAPTVETFAVAGVLLVSVDDATGKAYTAGTPSCVKPGTV